ncbi:u3 small nucleolar rna-associated protein 6homolog [Lichtheimia corymbifera JMRC:FSU:9682]|uniref:U3 small nucleolar rna-associated protein 6homolog n=1 Tax=Lichtheimia corymbifera JMRC:FSU:9682 TaxID=1263082 RepID=A0A068S445_9FUNG|nr:u3 small nucleolar rna-associated protein 6homolog [Lichtheimia corymbifera JMRC:FSU:9682]
MVPELEDLEKKGLFSKPEIKSIIKKRTKLEYAIRRRIPKKIDFLRYIEYEMNVETLRKKRKARINTTRTDDEEFGISEFSIKQRINALFQRALMKFKGDLSLWLEYIEHVKSTKAYNLLSGIFVNALQIHPTKALLWIMASSWEFEHNANPASARVLMQRGLRLNPTDELLWHEYFRLELLYVEKIKLRRRVLGVDDESLEKHMKQEDKMDVDWKDDSIKLPTITGEEAEDWKNASDERKTVKKMEESAAEALKEGNNPILQGILATIVYDNAIQAIPNDLEFRTKFIDIYHQFTDPEKGCDHVVETIQRDMADRPDARAYLASRHLFVQKTEEDGTSKYIACSDPAFVPALKACVEEFNQAIQDLPTAEMHERYIDFLQGWIDITTEENMQLYLRKVLQRVFKSAQKKNVLSPKIYQMHIENLMDSDKEKAHQVAINATEAYPRSAELWIIHIDLAKVDEDKAKLFKKALDRCPESYSLWDSYNDWINKQHEEKAMSTEETDQVYTRACESVTSLLPSLTTSTEERDRIKDLVLSGYVDWALRTSGIDGARTAYRKIIQNFYPTTAFYNTCLGIEKEHGKDDSIEYVYEMALRSNDRKEELYREYITHLREQRKFKKADHVLWKACKEVPDFDSKASN